MNVVPFNRQHFIHMLSWLAERGAYLPTVDETPENGFVVYDNHQPVAVAFIRLVEGGYGQLDCLVSNPKCSKELRNEAIDALVSTLMLRAKALGLKSISAFSRDKNTLERSSRHGFVQLPHTLIAADLSSK